VLIRGDARRIPLADESVQTVITSPPYWGLRDYGLEPSVWPTSTAEGAEAAEHEHDFEDRTKRSGGAYAPGSKKRWQHSAEDFTRDDRFLDGHPAIPAGSLCAKCGAWRGVLGLEPTTELYVAHLVEIFREVRRVLRSDGTVWLNLGDSYNAAGRETHGTRIGEKQGTNRASAEGLDKCRPSAMDLKPKDLVGIPWRVAFALQADGWWLRSDIIWAKPNPMPESVTDRPTKSHEYIFLLTKSERYYFDQDAVREPGSENSHGGGRLNYERKTSLGIRGRNTGCLTAKPAGEDGRNIRTVWTIATQPYAGAHFATFPEKIPDRCIRAGSRPGDLVLDPFGGSCTVAKVAIGLGRRVVAMDLKENYLKLGQQRIREAQPPLPIELQGDARLCGQRGRAPEPPMGVHGPEVSDIGCETNI